MKVSRLFLLVSCVSALAACAADSDDPSGQGGGNNGGGTTGGGTAGTLGNLGNSGTGAAASGGGAGTGTSAPITGSDKPIVIDDCPGNVSADNVAKLKDPGVQTVAPMRWLYPYEHTVFPRGLESPLLQWDEAAGAAEAVYVHLTSKLFDYQGCLPPTKAGQLQIPQDVWDTAGVQSRGATDPLTVELVTVAGGAASKLPPRKLTFALATLKNSIYYNTYGSALANQMGIVGGVVMRITPKQTQPDVFLKAQNAANCVGCHSVSSDGSKMVAEEHGGVGLIEGTSLLFDLKAAGAGTFPPPVFSNLKRAGFSALYPDGSVYLTTGRPQPGPLGGSGNVSGTFGPEVTKLYDASTGTEIAGSGAPAYALMPMFSTDGKMVAFNHLSDTGVGGKELAVMDFDRPSNKFSNLRAVYTDPSLFVGWPQFLPEVQASTDELSQPSGRKIIFALGQNPDYVTQDAPAGVTPHPSDLYWIDLDSGKVAPLSRAGGFEGTTNFMPYGDRDAHLDYIPTVSPVAAGGYFWLFFSSRRQYGNQLVYDNVQANEAKKIWVAAIDINAAPGSDPSHPPFFLPGQEAASGNIRAFAALSPCHVDGDSCESGIDCCSGHCVNGVCGTPVAACSELEEKCETTADCCEGKGLLCIGGFCGYDSPD